MYMDRVPLNPRTRGLRGLHALAEMKTMQMVSKSWCDAKGGSFQDTGQTWGQPWGASGTCFYEEAAPPPPPQPINWATAGGTGVKVPTTTQVQVSPQISPVFVQQFQPTGSPVGAGTAMTAAPVAQQADTAMQRYLELQAQREAAESERQAALMERLLATRAEQAAPQAQFLPMGPPPAEIAPEEAAPGAISATGGGAPAPGIFAAFGRGMNWLPLIAAAGIIAITMGGGKRGPGGRRKKRKTRR